MVGGADAESIEEANLKAALVLNFARFTTWPEDAFSGPADSMDLWVLGGETTRQAFDTLDGQQIDSRTIHVRHLTSLETIDRCHILFINRDADRPALSAALSAVGKRPVLTIGETPDFIRSGGLINIFNKDGRFHFEIKPAAALRRGLKLSSRLLKLAIILDD